MDPWGTSNVHGEGYGDPAGQYMMHAPGMGPQYGGYPGDARQPSFPQPAQQYPGPVPEHGQMFEHMAMMQRQAAMQGRPGSMVDYPTPSSQNMQHLGSAYAPRPDEVLPQGAHQQQHGGQMPSEFARAVSSAYAATEVPEDHYARAVSGAPSYARTVSGAPSHVAGAPSQVAGAPSQMMVPSPSHNMHMPPSQSHAMGRAVPGMYNVPPRAAEPPQRGPAPLPGELFFNITVERLGQNANMFSNLDSDDELVAKLSRILEQRLQRLIHDEGWQSQVHTILLPPLHGQSRWAPFQHIGQAQPGEHIAPTFVVARIMVTEKHPSKGGESIGEMIMNLFNMCAGGAKFDVRGNMRRLANEFTQLLSRENGVMAQIIAADSAGEPLVLQQHGWNGAAAMLAVEASRGGGAHGGRANEVPAPWEQVAPGPCHNPAAVPRPGSFPAGAAGGMNHQAAAAGYGPQMQGQGPPGHVPPTQYPGSGFAQPQDMQRQLSGAVMNGHHLESRASQPAVSPYDNPGSPMHGGHMGGLSPSPSSQALHQHGNPYALPQTMPNLPPGAVGQALNMPPGGHVLPQHPPPQMPTGNSSFQPPSSQLIDKRHDSIYGLSEMPWIQHPDPSGRAVSPPRARAPRLAPPPPPAAPPHVWR
eukprot:TRINITY_DN22653_c0_g1_i2.p1 TRINITY_DN22653_c0_g1~~TRINITY_DN22653_c0_g1_i2.p1  ORF type:complete len:641 (+),score=85.03 TRINITY_DN22653_c0_g1_i2:118-2040(+)